MKRVSFESNGSSCTCDGFPLDSKTLRRSNMKHTQQEKQGPQGRLQNWQVCHQASLVLSSSHGALCWMELHRPAPSFCTRSGTPHKHKHKHKHTHTQTHKHTNTHTHTNTQTSNETNKETHKANQTIKQANKQTNKQTNGRTNKPTSKHT